MDAQVSVIMPIYNKGEYIQKAIDSVLSQKCIEVELICIDDGSLDNSVEIIERNCLKQDNIKLIRQTNAGAGVARNTGMEQSSAECISFLDPDDWYPSDNVLSTLYAGIKRSNCSISMGKRLYYVKPFILKRKDNLFFEGAHNFSELTSAFLYQSCMFTRELLVDNSIYFPRYRRFQDPPFFLKAMSVAGDFYFVNNYVHCYRRGVQRIIWNNEKLLDYISGVRESLNVANEAGNRQIFNQVLDSLNHASFTEGVLKNASDSVISALYEIEKYIKEVPNERHIGIRALQIMQSENIIKKRASIMALSLENGIKSVF